jgi:hypothetical protein
MMTDEDYRGVKQKKGISPRAFLPAIGLILIIAFGAIAYVASTPLQKSFGSDLGMPDRDTGKLFFGVATFLVLVLSTGLLFTILGPKKGKQVSERDMDKERKMKQAEELMRKKRKEQAKVKMAQERKKSGNDGTLKR